MLWIFLNLNLLLFQWLKKLDLPNHVQFLSAHGRQLCLNCSALFSSHVMGVEDRLRLNYGQLRFEVQGFSQTYLTETVHASSVSSWPSSMECHRCQEEASPYYSNSWGHRSSSCVSKPRALWQIAWLIWFWLSVISLTWVSLCARSGLTYVTSFACASKHYSSVHFFQYCNRIRFWSLSTT